jgi:hypothetical protein
VQCGGEGDPAREAPGRAARRSDRSGDRVGIQIDVEDDPDLAALAWQGADDRGRPGASQRAPAVE